MITLGLSPTPQKKFCNGAKFESMTYPRHYAWCLRVDTADHKENFLQTQDNFLALSVHASSNRKKVFFKENQNKMVNISTMRSRINKCYI